MTPIAFRREVLIIWKQGRVSVNKHREMAKAIFYIDGYNWYHAIFKHFPEWKWLNIQESLRPHDQVLAVKVFSAMIDPDDLQAMLASANSAISTRCERFRR